jgi:hypothetical protein
MNFNFFGKKKTETGIRNEDLPEENHEFPDSHRPHGLCPRCNKQSSFENNGFLPGTYDSFYSVAQSGERTQLLLDRVSCLVCRNCNQPTIVFEEQFIGEFPKGEKISGGVISWRGFFWWPFLNIHSVRDVPTEITTILQEAKTCYSAQCYKASATMARRTLEAIIADKGATEKYLYQGIKKMKELEVIDKNLLEWATEVRLIGNAGAHFDPMDDVTRDDAKKVILFIEELVKFIYVIPAGINRQRSQNK